MDGPTREEYLSWAKARALEYANGGELQDAVMSMSTDLAKHPEFDRGMVNAEAVAAMRNEVPKGADAVRRWIVGWN